MEKNHGPQIKDDKRYERLREKGLSKEKSARIANTDRKQAGQRGGKASKYEDWSKSQLYEKAKTVGIKKRSEMSKKQLIDALRNN